MAYVVNNRLYFRVVSILYMHIIQSPFPVRFKTLSEFCMMCLRSVMSRPKKNPPLQVNSACAIIYSN